MIQERNLFDPGRAMLEDYLDGYPARLDVTETQSLARALAVGLVVADTRLLAFEHDDLLYTFPMSVVLSYNVIQGQIQDQPWMMTFCNACNTGMVFDPYIDGQKLHFRRRGSYDGLLLIWDEETNSYWQHITGQALYGTSAGKQLRMMTATRQMTTAQALAKDESALLLTSPLTPEQEKLSSAMEKMRSKPERLESTIISTIAQEDTRRPRFELGLGVWNENTSTYFPLLMLHMNENAVMTEFNGRKLLIYQEEDAIAPVAAYVDTTRAVWMQDVLRLDGGASIHNDLYVTADGQTQPLERPMQLLMRWYGFALTFPGCHVPGF